MQTSSPIVESGDGVGVIEMIIIHPMSIIVAMF